VIMNMHSDIVFGLLVRLDHGDPFLFGAGDAIPRPFYLTGDIGD